MEEITHALLTEASPTSPLHSPSSITETLPSPNPYEAPPSPDLETSIEDPPPNVGINPRFPLTFFLFAVISGLAFGFFMQQSYFATHYPVQFVIFECSLGVLFVFSVVAKWGSRICTCLSHIDWLMEGIKGAAVRLGMGRLQEQERFCREAAVGIGLVVLVIILSVTRQPSISGLASEMMFTVGFFFWLETMPIKLDGGVFGFIARLPISTAVALEDWGWLGRRLNVGFLRVTVIVTFVAMILIRLARTSWV